MNQRLFIKYYYNIFLLGFYSIVSQIYIIREVFTTFSGNELTSGIILAIWLAGSGLGNLLAQRLYVKLYDRKEKIFFFNLILFVVNIILLRYFTILFRFSPGELIPIFYLFLYAIILIMPFALLWGINFNYFYIQIKNVKNRESRIYYIEAAGSAIGSLFAVFFGMQVNSIFLIIAVLFVLYIISLLLYNQYFSIIFYSSVMIVVLLFIFHKKFNMITDTWRLKKFKIIDIRETPFGKLDVIKQEEHFSFYNNGVFLFTTGDQLSPELDVSLAIVQSKSLQNILVINNGIAGVIENLVKYPQIENITYLEYNRFLLDQYLNNVQANYLNDKRIHLIIHDPRAILKKLKMKFNIVFLNNGDPYNLLANRFFTVEFFKILKTVMATDGIVFLKLTSSENFINKYQSLYIGSILNTLDEQFQEVITIPGDNCYLLACNKKGILTYDHAEIKKRMTRFRIESEFFKNYFLKFNMEEFRVNSFINSISRKPKKNYDLAPISFYYSLVLWTTRTSRTLKKIFSFFYNIKFYKILIFLLLIFVVFNLKFLKSRESLVLLSMGVIGFTEISLEILSILLYQTIRGNLYLNMSFIFFSFMLGLSVGSFLYKHIKISTGKLFVMIQLAFIFIPAMLLMHYMLIRAVMITVFQDILFFIFILGFSILSGIQFPAAVNLYPDKIFGPGRINGIDLFSAAMGAVLISLFIIPLYGLLNSVFLLIILNLLAFIKINGILLKQKV